MDLRRIVARSGQAFRYILDRDTDLVSRTHLSKLEAIKRQLDESERMSREKDGLIAQLQEQLAAKTQQKKTSPAKAKKATLTRKRATAKKTASASKATTKPETTAKSKRSPRTRQS